jgi:hypothetical protein
MFLSAFFSVSEWALLLCDAALYKGIKLIAPYLQNLTHTGSPSHWSQVIVFFVSGLTVGAAKGQAYMQDLQPTQIFPSVMTAPVNSTLILAFVGQISMQAGFSQFWQRTGKYAPTSFHASTLILALWIHALPSWCKEQTSSQVLQLVHFSGLIATMPSLFIVFSFTPAIWYTFVSASVFLFFP